jgi:hypothetical protein
VLTHWCWHSHLLFDFNNFLHHLLNRHLLLDLQDEEGSVSVSALASEGAKAQAQASLRQDPRFDADICNRGVGVPSLNSLLHRRVYALLLVLLLLQSVLSASPPPPSAPPSQPAPPSGPAADIQQHGFAFTTANSTLHVFAHDFQPEGCTSLSLVVASLLVRWSL